MKRPNAAGAADLDPKEWDFRYIPVNQIPVVAVYEYARSCSWVRKMWSDWLESTIYLASEEPLTESQPINVRDALRTEFQSLEVPWNFATPLAICLSKSIPPVFVDMSIHQLAYCTPSFPASWVDLPEVEKRAALQLDPRSRTCVDFVRSPRWFPDKEFLLHIDFSRDITDLQKHALRWLISQKEAFDKQEGRSVGPRISVNRGRAHAVRKEALSWLVSYRFKAHRYTFAQAQAQIKGRLVPNEKTAVKIWTKGMTPMLWSDWRKKAKQQMDVLFQDKGIMFAPFRHLEIAGLRG